MNCEDNIQQQRPTCQLEMLTFQIIISALMSISHCREGFGPTDQEWGYVTVREGAHIFWWLHKTMVTTFNYTELPLVIWLQGGPGCSSTGYGNFAEIGPLDSNSNHRNTTWLRDVNIVFVDSPVGTGFSYVEHFDNYAKTNREIAQDFLVFLRGFYKAIPELQDTPLYIFSESYGGKMTAEIALVVDEAVKNGDFAVRLLGIGLGDAWISPIHSVLSWAPYLLNLGVIDRNGFNKISEAAKITAEVFQDGNYSFATFLWGLTERIILDVTDNVDFYNVLMKISKSSKNYHQSINDEINKIMNNQVKTALGLNRTFEVLSYGVFNALREDFMKPVTIIVELLLNTTDIRVAVFNGQLDLLVNTPGTVDWLDNLSFDRSADWGSAKRSAIVVDNTLEGYYKKSGHLAMYWVNRAGHMVPSDNPNAMSFILKDVLGNF